MAEPAGSSRPLSVGLRWSLAIVTVAVAGLLTTGPGGERLFPEPPERFVHGVTLLYAAGVLTGWLGGVGPGVLAAGLVGWLSVRRGRTEDALRASRDELELRVQSRTADLTQSNQHLQAEIAARTRAEVTLREQAELLD